MQAIKRTNLTTSAELQSSFQTQKSSKLVAIWKIENCDSGDRKLMCRWIRV